jgi:NTE family protein
MFLPNRLLTSFTDESFAYDMGLIGGLLTRVLVLSSGKIMDKGCTALVLPGGGARGAYQVGVLKAIREITADAGNPFPVICGTSAGAINAAVLASHAHEFGVGVDRLEQFWATMYCARVYRTDFWTVLKSAIQWALSMSLGGSLVRSPKALLDNEPLRQFLERALRLEGIDTAINNGSLRGLTVTASGYSCASAISFYQGQPGIEPWARARRHGRPAKIDVHHLMASAALPFLFPAVKVGNEYFGDGGIRMLAPLSPAIHLGADRLLVITTRDEKPDPSPESPVPYPTPGEIGGYLLDAIFMDTLNSDLNRLNRINRTLALLPENAQAESRLKRIDSLVIRPSRDLREVTQEHSSEVPRAVRILLRALGGWGRDWRMVSYLLFESSYCTELIKLGYQDGINARQDLLDFL